MKKILILENIATVGIDKLQNFFTVKNLVGVPRSDWFSELKDADAIIIKSVTQVNREFMNHAKNLKVVGRAGTGTDNIDLQYAEQSGIKVLTVPTGNSRSAAEFTVMQILAACKNFYEAVSAVRKRDFRRDCFQGTELSSQTVGIIGLGNVGSIVTQLLKPFGCRIVAYDVRQDIQERCQQLKIERAENLHQILSASDILTLHVSLTPQTRGMISAKEIGRMKKGIRIINCARGPLIDSNSILNAVKSGHVSQLLIDVLDDEPSYELPPEKQTYDNPLLHHPNIIITPHLAALTHEAQKNIALTLVDEMIAILKT